MTNELTIIGNRAILGKEVRVYGDFDNPLFLARDVAEWIEHSNHKVMLDSVDEDEKVKRVLGVNNPYPQANISGHGGLRENTEAWFLTENGLYEVLFLSRKPLAKEFKKGVKALLSDLRRGRSALVNLDDALTNPATLLQIVQNWKADRDLLDAATQKIAEDRPKVLFADAVSETKDCVLVGTMAKILGQNGMKSKTGKKIGRDGLFDILREDGYLCRSGRATNTPSQKAMNLNLFRIKETVHTEGNGRTHTNITPLVTGDGQKYFVAKYLDMDAEIVNGQLVVKPKKNPKPGAAPGDVAEGNQRYQLTGTSRRFPVASKTAQKAFSWPKP